MGIAPVTTVSSDVSVLGISRREALPLDTRRSDIRNQTLTPVDRFMPSVRTPLAADRLLAGSQSSAAAPHLLGQSQEDGRNPFTDTNAKDAESRPATSSSMPQSSPKADSEATADKTKAAEGGQNGENAELTEAEMQQVAKLKQRDAEVRAHEQAHMAAAGGLARGGASFSFQTGPDGKRYAVGGEVQIAMKRGNTPEETISNAEKVRAAALAPANPSSTDMQTAAAAMRMAQEARQELPTGNAPTSSSAKDSGTAKAESGSSSKTPSAATAERTGLRAGTERPEEKGAESAAEAPQAGGGATSALSPSKDAAEPSAQTASLERTRRIVPEGS